MRRWGSVVVACLLIACLLPLADSVHARPAHRPTPPPLTAVDEAQRREAAQRLNDRNPIMIGMVEHWQGETAEGAVQLDRIYRDHGLECHVLTEHFRSGDHGHWRMAHPVWCRVPEGNWRLRS